MRIAFSIARDGWKGMGRENEAMRVYKASTLLHDGHHRAAVLLAVHGGDFCIEVQELEEREIASRHECSKSP